MSVSIQSLVSELKRDSLQTHVSIHLTERLLLCKLNNNNKTKGGLGVPKTS